MAVCLRKYPRLAPEAQSDPKDYWCWEIDSGLDRLLRSTGRVQWHTMIHEAIIENGKLLVVVAFDERSRSLSVDGSDA